MLDDHSFNIVEHDVESKSKMFTEEKTAIARFAASLVDNGDFVFIDAGPQRSKRQVYGGSEQSDSLYSGGSFQIWSDSVSNLRPAGANEDNYR